MVALLAVVAPGAATAFVGCSGSDSNGRSGTPPADAGVQEGQDGAPPSDGGTSNDATVNDTDASEDASTDRDGASDDAALGFAEGGGFSGDCGVGSAGEPTDLRCTGLYADWASKTIATGLAEYDPGLHFWSDGADKTRWIALPPGQKIDSTDMDEWTFPVGTKIWKEFRLALGDAGADAGQDGGAETRIETRMLWKRAAGSWYRTTYRWTDDGVSDATELTTGQTNVAGTTYEVPSQSDCDTCHNGRIDGVMGFEAVALSSPLASGLTMQALTTQGLLTAPPSSPIVIPGSAGDAALLGWMHMNCGVSCHNRGNGAAAITHFYLRLDVGTLATEKSTDAYTTGWNVVTQNFSIPGVSTTYRFHSCDVGASASYYRADERDGVDGTATGVQMPPLVSHLVDAVDVAAMQTWINQGCDGGL
jgi:hypothetical protein